MFDRQTKHLFEIKCISKVLLTSLRRCITNPSTLRSFPNCSAGSYPDIVLLSSVQAFQFYCLRSFVGFCYLYRVYSNSLRTIIAERMLWRTILLKLNYKHKETTCWNTFGEKGIWRDNGTEVHVGNWRII